jgi:NADPH-dependent curcumin reductase CurA
VTAAAVTNPGMAAWKTLLWEGELAAGQAVLVLGATGTSGSWPAARTPPSGSTAPSPR